MRSSNIKKLCELIASGQFTHSEIGSMVDVSPNTIRRYKNQLAVNQLDYDAVKKLSEQQLDSLINSARTKRRSRFIEPDCAYLYEEMRLKENTLSLLYEEYANGAGELGMSETEFRRRYKRHCQSLGIVMRQPHAPGRELYLDYSGKRPKLTNPKTGEKTPVELFVAVWGASKKTFVCATRTQNLRDWCDANVKALEFFGGVPQLLIPDNLKSAVTRTSATDGPTINFTYDELAHHYDCRVKPARPKKPKDKALVEGGVLLIQRWILARLRHEIFFSLADLNSRIQDWLVLVNAKPMRGFGGKSRDQLFTEIDLPALKPLPVIPYEYADWSLNVTVPADYHVRCFGNYYSVPHSRIRNKVNIRATTSTVEIFPSRGLQPIATHCRSYEEHSCITKREHQPKAHQHYADDDQLVLESWAFQAGDAVHRFAKKFSDKHRNPVKTVKVLRALKGLAKEYDTRRLNAACDRAIRIHSLDIASVRSMLVRRIESAPIRGETPKTPPPTHENVRGANFYR